MSVERMKELLAEMDAETSVPGQLHFHGLSVPTEDLYAARNRAYSPLTGRWMQNDPVAYVEGDSLYPFVKATPRDER